MSIEFNEKLDAQKMSEIHLMPCKIEYTGEANVKDYFNYYTSANSDQSNILINNKQSKTIINEIKTLSHFLGIDASFRGRPLNGVINELAKDTKSKIGLVVDYNIDKNEQKVSSMFNKVHSWQLDEPLISHNSDSFTKALKEWFDVSEIVR